MNCFLFKNHSSDYLEQLLSDDQRKDFEKHLKNCESCETHIQHQQILIEKISKLAWVTLPESIRASPFSTPLLNTENKNQLRQTRWGRSPWFIRTSIESIGIAIVILIVVASVPKLRNFYQKWTEQRLESYDMTELVMEPEAATEDQPDSAIAQENDETAENETEESSTTTQKIHVGNSEIWRFFIKTDSPREMRPKITKLLTELHALEKTENSLGLPHELQGTEAPGGIQFNLLVSKTIISELKQKIQNIQVSSSLHPKGGLSKENFTWYKSKSKRFIPSGKTRVVIWLSQI